ncbi:hypothetical protein [Spartinivicinus ruber]|uniref:hypothetical protein n=1 Tax=Spartinivicinus ruber TaxID=2683272 RepID=UPI0013D80184|nr:hypothetical protein [Spartinivicinus ruber]
MINDKLGLQPWKPRTRVFNYRRAKADKKEIGVTEFILDQSAGIANQAIVKMLNLAKTNKYFFNFKKLSQDNQQLIKKIYQYIEFFEKHKGHKPYLIRLTHEQIRGIESDCEKAGMPPPQDFQGVFYVHYLGAV